MLDMEREMFGFTHSQLSDWLGEQWQLPLEIRQAIATHHDRPEVWENPLQATVNPAETFANGLDIPPSPYNSVYAVSQSAQACLGLEPGSEECVNLLGRAISFLQRRTTQRIAERSWAVFRCGGCNACGCIPPNPCLASF